MVLSIEINSETDWSALYFYPLSFKSGLLKKTPNKYFIADTNSLAGINYYTRFKTDGILLAPNTVPWKENIDKWMEIKKLEKIDI